MMIKRGKKTHNSYFRIECFLFVKTLNSLHPRMLGAKFGWKCPSGSGDEDVNVKSLRQWRQRQRRRTTNKFRSEKLTLAFGSGGLKIAQCFNAIPFHQSFLYTSAKLYWLGKLIRLLDWHLMHLRSWKNLVFYTLFFSCYNL